MSGPEAVQELIRLQDVTVTGSELQHNMVRVQQVNWSIRRGDYWVVTGAPGSGKSDLLSTAAGLQKPGKGTHLIFGKPIQQLNEEELIRERMKIGYVFQGGGRLFNQLSVQENIGLPICYHQDCPLSEAQEKIHTVLNLVEITSLARRRPSEITRNLHPRISLARALALQPEVLFIDNPLLGTDPNETAWWLKFLEKASTTPLIEGRKLTLVIAADDLRPWRSQGKQFAVIHEENWVEIGDARGLGGKSLELLNRFSGVNYNQA
ncbi:MAG: ATP-binding cassette domain-containing protein [Verrucomicrobiota bacterium]|nr:ATP-binding cassette domain-containing protein [Verrucomicrobiota bacterium]